MKNLRVCLLLACLVTPAATQAQEWRAPTAMKKRVARTAAFAVRVFSLAIHFTLRVGGQYAGTSVEEQKRRCGLIIAA